MHSLRAYRRITLENAVRSPYLSSNHPAPRALPPYLSRARISLPSPISLIPFEIYFSPSLPIISAKSLSLIQDQKKLPQKKAAPFPRNLPYYSSRRRGYWEVNIS